MIEVGDHIRFTHNNLEFLYQLCHRLEHVQEVTQGVEVDQHGVEQGSDLFGLKFPFMERVEEFEHLWVGKLGDRNHIVPQFNSHLQQVQSFIQAVEVGDSPAKENFKGLDAELAVDLVEEIEEFWPG